MCPATGFHFRTRWHSGTGDSGFGARCCKLVPIAAKFKEPARLGAAVLGYPVELVLKDIVCAVFKLPHNLTIPIGGSLGSWVDEERS